MGHKVVIFENGKVKRIAHMEDISNYKDRTDVLIDPAYPRGIPPHEWELHPDGNYLVGTSKPENSIAKKESWNYSKLWTFLIGAAFGSLIMFYFRR